MITTHVHNISSSTLAFTTSGIDVFESGPTNFTISFSGADANGTYLKFLVKYPDDSNVYTILSPTDDLDDIRTQSIDRKFYPEHDEYLTTYTIDVSGLKNDLTTDLYRINLKIGRDLMTKYGDLKLIGSHLYTSDQGSNYCLLTLENQSPRFVSNVIVPFVKAKAPYLPVFAPPFIADDDKVLRTEILTRIGGQVPVCAEVTFKPHVSEQQWEILAIGQEGGADRGFGPSGPSSLKTLLEHHITGIPSRDWGGGQTTGRVSRGDKIDDFMVWVPEDGIDYSTWREEAGDGFFANDRAINVTITEIYPGGIAA